MTDVRVSQVVVEVLRLNTSPNVRASQVTAEVLRIKRPAALVSQVAAEVLRRDKTGFEVAIDTSASIRCILAELKVRSGGVETTRYISSRPYVDSVAGRVYLPVLRASSVQLVERLSIDGTSTINFGDIEADNTSGELDGWFNDIWSSRAVTVLSGDVRWPRANFNVIFNGVIEDIGSKARNTINFTLRDKLQRLNTTVSDTKLGGSTSNKNELIPLCFGECFNVSPLLTNPATLEYQVHNGGIESIIEVRDNGVPVTKTATLGTGKFTLAATPAGKVTASVQGSKGASYQNNVRQIVQMLVTNYGTPVSNRFSGSDLDTVNLDEFETANQQPIGVYLDGRENLLTVCSEISGSVGAQLVMSREGRLQLIKVDIPVASEYDITADDIINGTLAISEKVPVVGAFKLGFDKNYTVQTGLLTGIPAAHKSLYAQEWLTVTSSDATVKANYRQNEEPQQRDTFLLTTTDATDEADRLLALFSVPRFVVSFESPASMMFLRLGDAVTIYHDRFGLDAGRIGMIIGLSLDWDKHIVKVEVLI